MGDVEYTPSMNPQVHCGFAVMICRMGSLDVMGDPLRQEELIVAVDAGEQGAWGNL